MKIKLQNLAKVGYAGGACLIAGWILPGVLDVAGGIIVIGAAVVAHKLSSVK